MGLFLASGANNYFMPESDPAHALSAARFLEEQAQSDPAGVLAELKATSHDCPSLAANPVVFNAAAPRLLAQLAKAGYVKEVAPLLARIPDPQQRRTALEGILPQWMDADPAAARDAFNAAPFTALERERWQRHPSFLLNPESAEK